MATYLIDTHSNLYMVKNGLVYFLDERAKSFFLLSGSAEFFSWFKEKRAEGEQLFHFSKSSPVLDSTVDDLASPW